MLGAGNTQEQRPDPGAEHAETPGNEMSSKETGMGSGLETEDGEASLWAWTDAQ